MTGTFLLLQIFSRLILVLSLIASCFSPWLIWRLLMLIAGAGILLFGVLAYFPSLFGMVIPGR